LDKWESGGKARLYRFPLVAAFGTTATVDASGRMRSREEKSRQFKIPSEFSSKKSSTFSEFAYALSARTIPLARREIASI
jgi:hypothetical protein